MEFGHAHRLLLEAAGTFAKQEMAPCKLLVSFAWKR